LAVIKRTAGARAAATRADVALYRLVRRHRLPPPLDRGLHALTRSGENAACWYAIGLAGSILEPAARPRWHRAMVAVFATQMLNNVLKVVFRRKRPALADLPALVPVPTSLSFPSAHASTSFCGARVFAGLAPVPLGPVAAAIAYSRVYFGVHYPSDVLVGAGVGTFVAGAVR
jgi:undecaprenyl-diphosphatase